MTLLFQYVETNISHTQDSYTGTLYIPCLCLQGKGSSPGGWRLAVPFTNDLWFHGGRKQLFSIDFLIQTPWCSPFLIRQAIASCRFVIPSTLPAWWLLNGGDPLAVNKWLPSLCLNYSAIKLQLNSYFGKLIFGQLSSQSLVHMCGSAHAIETRGIWCEFNRSVYTW